MDSKPESAFAVWVTGLPGSGKSTFTAALVKELEQCGVHAAVLESDELRKIFTPNPLYSDQERDTFYTAIAYVGKLLTDHGVPVIFDATANRRAYRDRARQQIIKFLEVFVDCPLPVCMQRDPKGLYRKAQAGGATTLPGLQTAYEPPASPDLVVRSDQDSPVISAQRMISLLQARKYISTPLAEKDRRSASV